MKQILSILLVFCMALGLAACGVAGGAAGGNGDQPAGQFKAGFGKVDITPKGTVPLASYGDLRFNDEGILSKLEARAVAVQDANGGMLVFIVGDVSWCPEALGSVIKPELASELGIPEANIILSGTHTHNSVDTGNTEYAAVVEFNKKYIAGMKEAAHLAVKDLKPAELYAGSANAVGMNFVRRYIMDDGSLVGDNAYGTGTVIVDHETIADSEVGLLRFVREGGKDILISNFQAHPHLEGKGPYVSAQTVGAIRDAVEKQLDAYSLHWNGAAGNLNTTSRITSENKYTKSDRVKYGEDMVRNYIAPVYDSLTKVNAGNVQVREYTYVGKVDKSMNDYVEEANKVNAYFNNGLDHTAAEAATYAHSLGVGINSVYHARRILGNLRLPDTQELTMVAWSFGDVGGVVNAFEMFDVTGMYIKKESPFARTFIVGYSYPGGGGYIPTKEGFANGGYESDNCMFVPGTAEEIADQYLAMLRDMHG